MNAAPRRSCRARRGFTLIELLIGMALTAVLMVASGAAFVAASRSAEAGDRYIRASRTSSRVLETLVAEVHRASAVTLPSTTSMQLVRDDGSIVTYRYDATPRELHLVQTIGGADVDNVLARQIDSLSFSSVVEPDPSTQVNRIVQVTVTMKINDGNNATTAMTASANCRRKRSYR